MVQCFQLKQNAGGVSPSRQDEKKKKLKRRIVHYVFAVSHSRSRYVWSSEVKRKQASLEDDVLAGAFPFSQISDVTSGSRLNAARSLPNLVC